MEKEKSRNYKKRKRRAAEGIANALFVSRVARKIKSDCSPRGFARRIFVESDRYREIHFR